MIFKKWFQYFYKLLLFILIVSETMRYPYNCYAHGSRCCESCVPHEKPWLGPDCLYGDRASWCPEIQNNAQECSPNWDGDYCCDSCCSLNGAPEG